MILFEHDPWIKLQGHTEVYDFMIITWNAIKILPVKGNLNVTGNGAYDF